MTAMLQVYETRAQVYVRSKTTIKFITKNNCNSGGTKLTSDYDQIDRICLFKVIQCLASLFNESSSLKMKVGILLVGKSVKSA